MRAFNTFFERQPWYAQTAFYFVLLTALGFTAFDAPVALLWGVGGAATVMGVQHLKKRAAPHGGTKP